MNGQEKLTEDALALFIFSISASYFTVCDFPQVQLAAMLPAAGG